MAKHIDLSNKLSKEKPSITIGDVVLQINDEKSNVLKMNSILKNTDGLSEVELMDKTIETLIGKAGFTKLEKMKLSFSDYKTVYFAIVAVINDQELGDVEANFRKANE